MNPKPNRFNNASRFAWNRFEFLSQNQWTTQIRNL